MVLFALLIGCQEYVLHEPPKVEPAKPPAALDGDHGDPPDWQDCFEGYLGVYSNLSVDHPDMNPPLDEVPTDDPMGLDWWDEPSFQRFDAGLDFGGNWWPIDEGLAGDPEYYAVRWIAWLRAWDDTTFDFTLGSADDSWMVLNGEVIAAQPGVHPFEPATYSVSVDSGQYPLEIRYAHRGGDSGFRFRHLSGDLSICYPDFEDQGDE